MSEVVSINVGKEVIAPIVQSKIEAAIIEHLADFKSVVNCIVTRTLQEKVDSDGKAGGYYAKHTYLEWVCNSMLRDSIKKAVKNVLEKKAAEVEAACEKEILKSKTILAQAFIKTMGDVAQNSYRMTINVDAK